MTQRMSPVTGSSPESGFMLASVAGIILITIALLSTFVFVVQRDFRFKNHYAAGQRSAKIAVQAHHFAQRIFHQGTPVAGLIVFDSEDVDASPMMLADDALFGMIGGVRYGIEIRGWDKSPIADSLADDKAVSAYMQIKIRNTGTSILRPTDRTAFMSGAAQQGMTRIGVIHTTSGETCDGDTQVVRWGPETTACLTAMQLATLGFNDFQDGDLIVPTWEVALAVASPNALYRYAQPERPELNSMTANLAMLGQDVLDVTNITSRALDADGNVNINRMTVRSGHSTHFTQQATMHDAFHVRNDDAADPTTPSMHVSGVAQFTSAQFNVVDTLQVGDASNPVLVDVVNPVATNDVLGMDTQLVIQPYNPSDELTLAAQQSSVAIGSITVLDPSASGEAHLAATGGVITGILQSTDTIFAGNTHILPSATNLHSSTGISTGAIEQIGIGPTRKIHVHAVTTPVCTGVACPDFVTDTPGGEL